LLGSFIDLLDILEPPADLIIDEQLFAEHFSASVHLFHSLAFGETPPLMMPEAFLCTRLPSSIGRQEGSKTNKFYSDSLGD